MSITASEHCFDFIDAKQDSESSNRYWFDYPEFWFSNQDLCDLSIGLRSIILKSSPVYLYIENLFVENMAINVDLNEFIPGKGDPSTWVPTYRVLNFDGDWLFPSRMYLNYQKHVDEKMDMNSLCSDMNNWYVQKFKEWDRLCDRIGKSMIINLFHDTVQFTYNEEGDFCMGVDDPVSYRFTYLSKFEYDLELNPENPDNYHPVKIFSDSFHQLFGLNPEKVNINTILTNLFKNQKLVLTTSSELIKYQAELDIKAILKDAESHGIIINNPTADDNDWLSRGYMFDNKTTHEWYQSTRNFRFSFTSIIIKNVWSRKDIRLESSMSEYDLHHYLGYSSYSSNTASYASPKIFDIKSRVNKFWINLYDGYTKNPLKLPEGISLLMETQLYQSDKAPLNKSF